MTDYKTDHRRYPDRGSTDRAVIDAIFDEAIYCHLGFVDDGVPYVIPTIHVRVDDTIVLHGSPASRMMRIVKSGADVCITASLLDGIVLARSVFHHSMNYRSAMVFGQAAEITDPDLKREAMRVFTDKILPGRWDDARRPTEKEFRGTLMAGLTIDAATAKVRSGPPADDPDDVDLPIWAGEIPYGLQPGTPVPSPDLPGGIEFPTRLRSHLGLD
jgi:nitroimidazol reductase NimA-like FMN-containing flavoprotein (pyridoxamine 5'-phosphate oxidase superfamily)